MYITDEKKRELFFSQGNYGLDNIIVNSYYDSVDNEKIVDLIIETKKFGKIEISIIITNLSFNSFSNLLEYEISKHLDL